MSKEVKIIKAEKKVNRRNSRHIERTRVAAYCRVSTDSEEQLLSYNSQVRHYKEFVQSNPKWELAGIYADEGITGTQTSKRLNFQKMINDAVDNKIDLIITKSISRFARNTVDTLKYVRLLKEHNVAVLFEKENINTLDMGGEMLLTILSSLAQQESESISSNVKMGLKMKMKRGEMVGFNGALGYDYDPKTKTITINEEEAEIVRYIFRRYIEGAGSYVIAKELTQLGYKTKRGNIRWHDSTVKGIIKNVKYKGDLLLGKTFTIDPISHRRLENFGEEEKYYIRNNHEPIISEEVFNKAQEILKKRSAKHSSKGRGEKYSRKYAFSSMIECGFCNSHFSRRTWHGSSQYQKVVWSCITATKRGRKHCPDSKSISEQDLEAAFVDAFNMLCKQNKELVEEFLKNVEKTLSDTGVVRELKRVEKEVEKIEAKMGKLVDMYMEGNIHKNVYEDKYFKLEADLSRAKAKQQELQSTSNSEKELEKRIEVFRELFKNNKTLEKFDREIFESVIEKILIGKEDEDGNRNPYAVTFIFRTGLKTEKDCSKKTKKTEDEEELYPHSAYEPCGVRGID